MAAEIERTKEGLSHAKTKGIKLSHPKGPGKSRLDKHDEESVVVKKMVCLMIPI